MSGVLTGRKAVRFASKALFILAVFLISANAVGLVTSLRNDEIFLEKYTVFHEDITLTAKEVHDIIAAPAADKKSYVKAITHAVNKGIAHYFWLDEGIEKYNLRVPFHDNYLLFIASYVVPQYYRKYEFRDYRRAIERGVGLCSQHAIIVAEILRDKGINSRIIGLSGHVVAAARVEDERGKWWTLDADYGVVIPHSPEELEDRPHLIAPYYRDQGYDEATVAELMSTYGKEGNVFFDDGGARNYGWKIYWAERAAYILIWIIPLLLMLPSITRCDPHGIHAALFRTHAGRQSRLPQDLGHRSPV